MRTLHFLVCHDEHDQKDVEHKWWCWHKVGTTEEGIWCEEEKMFFSNPSIPTTCPGPHREAVVVTGSVIEKETT